MTIGRNDHCSCGSGKKYKKCCMKKEAVIEINQVKEERFMQQKHDLVLKIDDFLLSKIPLHELAKLRNEFEKRGINRATPNFDGLFQFWRMFFHRYPNGKRGVEWFFEKKTNLRTDELNMAKRWAGLVPKLIQIVDKHEKGAIVEDQFTGDRLLLLESETFKERTPWAGCFCLLEPFDGGYAINGVTAFRDPGVLKLAKVMIEELMHEKNLEYNDAVFEYFPEIFSLFLNGKKADGKDRGERTITSTALQHKVLNKQEVVQFIMAQEEIVVDEWSQGNGSFSLSGDWIRYDDNAANGSVYLAKVHGQIQLKNDNLSYLANDEQGIENFQQFIKPVESALLLMNKKEKSYKIPMNIEVGTYVVYMEEGVLQAFGSLAQHQLLLGDVDTPFPLFDNLSPREMATQGRAQEVEQWLREKEYNSFDILMEQHKELPATTDYNSVRKELGLPLSPFVTLGEKRVTALTKSVNPFPRPHYISEQDMPIYQQLGFTPETSRAFYANDILGFFKKQVSGKSAATVQKYVTGVSILVDYLQNVQMGKWNELQRENWEELLSYFYFETVFETSNNHLKSFLSVLRSFIKWVDKRHQTSHYQIADNILAELGEQIYKCVEVLDLFVPYYRRKHQQTFHDGFLNVRQGLVGYFQIESVSVKSVRIRNIIEKKPQRYTLMLPPHCTAIMEPGMIISGTIAKDNINAWKVETVERVYPEKAELYLFDE
ncbi:SEC-C metal-binding domain-containing protein [Bacillus sp. T33-2]|uniref:SEC-C metal-binding domain-containing protein n=1 Tax=Bacillus sp. T33-2 TaxID=2054168 RepID=UPI000C77E0A8|nr:SEC-C metal-binding domain-containing protein [Bacillus sp. T33-2]PLR97842.1 hypothetical protein CVD19_06805 [Bacillus sp. T33-2]